MSPRCHLTLNLDSSSEGKKGVLTLKTATEGGAVSELVWCPEYEGVFGASFYPPTMEKHHMTPEPWRRLNGEDRKDSRGGPDSPEAGRGSGNKVEMGVTSTTHDLTQVIFLSGLSARLVG